MKMDRYLPPNHPLSRVYRVGAALFGAGLTVFGALGLANQLAFFTTHGQQVLGLSSNGLLSVVSVVVGVVLIAAAVVGGAAASTTTAVIGALFILSGLGNLAVLDTRLNVFAFKIPNVLFSLVAGLLMLLVGFYGRVSGGLPDDNPYVRARRHEDPADDHAAERAAERLRLVEIDELARAELAVAEGTATREQERLVRADALHRATERRMAAYQHAEQSEREFLAWLEHRRQHPPPEHFVLWHRRPKITR
jgi:hypothetical protein